MKEMEVKRRGRRRRKRGEVALIRRSAKEEEEVVKIPVGRGARGGEEKEIDGEYTSKAKKCRVLTPPPRPPHTI